MKEHSSKLQCYYTLRIKQCERKFQSFGRFLNLFSSHKIHYLTSQTLGFRRSANCKKVLRTWLVYFCFRERSNHCDWLNHVSRHIFWEFFKNFFIFWQIWFSQISQTQMTLLHLEPSVCWETSTDLDYLKSILWTIFGFWIVEYHDICWKFLQNFFRF